MSSRAPIHNIGMQTYLSPRSSCDADLTAETALAKIKRWIAAGNDLIPQEIPFGRKSHFPQMIFCLFITGHGSEYGACFAEDGTLAWKVIIEALLEGAHKLVRENAKQ